VLVADGSIEATGDVLGALAPVLADSTVGLVGPFGLATDDLRQFRRASGPDVDAVEGYLMAFRRDVLRRGAMFDPRYRFYRAADLDLSFQIRALGLRAVRVDVPVRRHEHRAWYSTPPDRRAALSKRNFYRFLDRFRGRTDLLARGTGGSV
jgi:cysteinyl-tRNA synthetase